MYYNVNDSTYHQKLQQTFYKIFQWYSPSSEIRYQFTCYVLKVPHFRQVAYFETKLNRISKLILMNNSKAVITCYKDEILQRIQFAKYDLKIEQELSKPKVFDLGVMPNDDILLLIEECELKAK